MCLMKHNGFDPTKYDECFVTTYMENSNVGFAYNQYLDRHYATTDVYYL